MNKFQHNLRVLLVVESSKANNRDFLYGISKYADKHGPWLFHFIEPGAFDRTSFIPKENISSLFPKWEPTGIITCHYRLTKRFTDYGVPTLLITGSELDNDTLPKIIADNNSIGRMAAKEFIERRYTDFAYCGFDGYTWSQQRSKSFSNVLSENGFSVSTYNIKNIDDEKRILAEWLIELPKPVGLFVCNDECGREIIEICESKEIAVPEDIAVLGVGNDYMICNFCTPSLSSIKLNAEAAGYQSAEMLYKLMVGRIPEKKTVIVCPLGIEARLSTDKMAMADEDLRKAIEFIRRHCQENIQVNDVVRAVAVSRQKLQGKFKNILGRSISDEIKQKDAERISKMLLETDLSVQQIALKFGHSGISHIARFFKKYTGFTPTEFRKKYGSN